MVRLLSIVVPTLNEEGQVGALLRSLRAQTFQDFETIVIDGGSSDRTTEICLKGGASVSVIEGLGEFQSRNFGAKIAKGDVLVFSCADVVFPHDLLKEMSSKFEDRSLLALAHATIPSQGSFVLRFEYELYNVIRYISSKMPFPLRRFSSSTNFLAVRKSVFDILGGFENDINADGLLGRKLVQMGKTYFGLRNPLIASDRRANYMGLMEFNKHYLYMLENFIWPVSKSRWLQKMKLKRRTDHKKMHLEQDRPMS
ncbi:MAG: hypothetical protein QG670_1322 [Thermoproteota archaeon]|nr:hypothetical protein [Thermoproteota archaeon]